MVWDHLNKDTTTRTVDHPETITTDQAVPVLDVEALVKAICLEETLWMALLATNIKWE
jgi:hypothetical protein